MENTKLERINELARLSKQRELNPEEKQEQQILRQEYIAEFRAATRELLDNTYIQTPDGKKHPLPRKDRGLPN